MGMRIWHQSMTVLDVLPAYRERIQAHAKKIVHADTEVVVHGLAIDTYPSDYPGGDITFNALFSIHSLQWLGSAAPKAAPSATFIVAISVPKMSASIWRQSALRAPPPEARTCAGSICSARSSCRESHRP